MSRRFTTMPFTLPSRLGLLSLLTAALWLAPALAGRAASYLYGTNQRTINAGVLVNGSAGTPIAPPTAGARYATPSETYVFQILNQRSDIKPFGWNIVNPRAPGTVTVAIQTRWTAYSVGQAVSPNMAAYWEVPLDDVTADQLQQYDILYLPPGGAALSVADNEKLRRFVDGGGQLWVSGAGPSFMDTQVSTGGAGLAPPQTGLASQPLAMHPLLTSPFFLSYNDYSTLGKAATTSDITDAGLVSGDFKNLYANVLTQSGGTAGVVAAQYGGGQVVDDSLDIGGAINNFAGDATNASNPYQFNNGPYFGSPGNTNTSVPNIYAAPTQDLKFLCNLISWSETHPNENKTPHQNAANSDLASFAPTWSYPTPSNATSVTGANAPPGAAIFGNFVYVTTADGVLHAFDAYPAESLTGALNPDNTLNPDDGSIQDFSGSPTMAPTPYDEVWHTPFPGAAGFLGAGASAPTVITYGGQTFVLIEKADGTIVRYFAIKGTPAPLSPFTTTSTASYPTTGHAPAPTYYEGRVFAGQADGTLLVGNLVDGKSYNVVLLNSPGEAINQSPAVGIIPDGTLTNDIVALVPGNQNMYSVLLGARADPLLPLPPTPPSSYPYNVNRSRLYSGQNLALAPTSRAYTFAAPTSGTAANASPPDFSLPAVDSYYADWDADIAKMYPASPANTNADLNHTVWSAFTPNPQSTGGVTASAALSAPALGKNGDFYYTENFGANSYLICAHDAAQLSRVQMRWRFRMPTTGESTATNPLVDADGVDYTPLAGYSFVGAPVADAQGNVYALATKTVGTPAVTTVTVLCFSANGTIYADLPGSITDPGQAAFTQADEDGGASPNTLRPGNLDGLDGNGKPIYGQYVVNGRQVVFYNFAIAAYNGVQRQVAGNFSEPQPVVATPAEVPGQDGTQTVTPTPLTLPLHTNLNWYVAPFPVSGPVLGLSKVGGSLFLTDGVKLYQIPAASSGKIATYDSASVKAMLNPLGAVAVPSIGGNVMILNSLYTDPVTGNKMGKVQAYTQQLTLIADNNRILETDQSGNALWAVDSTFQDTGLGTHVGFSHPVSLSQVALNDYLVADTGNNRCVRFDRAGKVLWELTRFTDISNLLKTPGEPTTLNSPTSVQMRQETVGTSTLLHYLVADSGNHRIVEVTDTYDSNGVLTSPHVLTWVSHTDDVQGRKYRYGGAAYYTYTDTAGKTYPCVAALVTNTRIASQNNIPTSTTFGPATGDAPGSSIILLDYTPAATPRLVFTSVPTAGGTTYPMHDSRFLGVTVSGNSAAAPNPPLLYADGNGAFELNITANPVTKTVYLTPGYLSFVNGTTADPANTSYKSMTISLNTGVTPSPVNVGGSLYPARTVITFQPSCIQRLDAPTGAINYLITQGGGQSELGNATSLFGGEVFQVQCNTTTGVCTAQPSYSGGTLARPVSTSPLTQPTFAIRPQ